MENTICLRTAALALIAASVLGSAKADSITWTGEGDTTAWSDGGNWAGGTAPAKDDIAILPAGATVGATQADVNYMMASATKLGGIHFSDDDTVLLFTNLTVNTTFSVPFTGKGECRMFINSAYLNMSGNSSEYLGSYVISNSPVYLSTTCGFGTTNSVTYWGNSGPTKYFTFKAGLICTNEFHLRGREWLFYGANNATLWGPVHVWGSARLQTAGSCAMTYYGGIKYEGSSTGDTGPLFVGQQKFYGKPVDFGKLWMRGDASGNYSGGGTWYVGTDVNAAVMAPPNNNSQGFGRVIFARSNCLTPSTGLRLGRANGTSTRVDLNGYDQWCGELSIAKNGAMDTAYTFITSSADATLTILDKGPTQFNGLIKGKVSLELNSTNSATAGSIGLCGTNNTTTGSLIARRGKINVLPEAVFSNLTALVASGEGIINVQMAANLDGLRSIKVSDSGQVVLNSTCLNENLTALEVSDSGSVTLDGGTYKFYSLKVGGRYLAAGDYAIDAAALGGVFTGTGSISVFTKPVAPAGDYVWSGETSADMHVGNNWNGGDLPDYEEGNATAVFDDTGTALAEMTAAGALNGIRFERGTSFTLGGTAPVGLGADGLSAENTAAAGTVTNKLETTLHLDFLPQKQWSLGARTILDVRAPMTSITLDGAEPVGIGGSGTVWLNASSPDLNAPMTFTNSMTRILAPLALGSTNREVRLKAGQIRFAGAGLTNDVPIRFIGNVASSPSTTYQTDSYNRVGDRWIQRGKVTAEVSTSMACGDGYRFQGGFETDGGSWSLYLPANCHLYIEDNPIRCSGGIYLDNQGHYHFCTTNNVHGTVQINCGTLHLDRDYTLCESGTLQLGVSWNDNFNGDVNLEGHVNKIGRVTCGWTPSSKPTRASKVLGASGTLEVVGATGSNLAINFQGGTSYKHSGTSTNVFWNAVSTSTGRLEVVNGKVTFRDGAGWSAVRNVTISGTGVIGVQATSADVAFGPEAGRSRATLEFPDDTGTLEIESGTVTVRKLMIGGLYWGPGTYGASDLPSRISGGGSLRVLSGGGSILVVR